MKDPAVTLCTPATRGVWIDLLCAMHDLDRSGELRGTAEQLARIARCQTVDLVLALTDLQTTGAADVTERNGTWFICNRRMRADCIKRKVNAERQMRRRLNSCHGPPNSKIPLYEGDSDNDFELFWIEFPRGRKGSKGTAREAFFKATAKATPAVLIAAAKAYAASEVGRGKYVKMPATWLNQECWQDDPQSWKKLEEADGEAKPSEYRRVALHVFNTQASAGEFLIGPHKDLPADGEKHCRVHGQLKNKMKIESHTDPKWKP